MTTLCNARWVDWRVGVIQVVDAFFMHLDGELDLPIWGWWSFTIIDYKKDTHLLVNLLKTWQFLWSNGTNYWLVDTKMNLLAKYVFKVAPIFGGCTTCVVSMYLKIWCTMSCTLWHCVSLKKMFICLWNMLMWIKRWRTWKWQWTTIKKLQLARFSVRWPRSIQSLRWKNTKFSSYGAYHTCWTIII